MLNMKAVETFIGMQNSNNTKLTYARGINNFLSYMMSNRGFDTNRKDWCHVTHDDIVGYKEYWDRSGLKLSTASTYWDGINSFFNYLLTRGLVQSHPFKGVKKPHRIVDEQRLIVPNEWVEPLIRAAANDKNDLLSFRDQAIIGLMSNGLRISEIASLDAGDLSVINHSSQFISERETNKRYGVQVLGKGKKKRVVPLNDTLAYLPLANYLSMRKLWPFNHGEKASVPMFPSPNGGRITTRTIQLVFQRAMRASGATAHGFVWSPHSLRHNYATRMLKAGVDLATLSKLLGHSDVKTTMVYLHLGTDDLAAAANLDPLDNAQMRGS